MTRAMARSVVCLWLALIAFHTANGGRPDPRWKSPKCVGATSEEMLAHAQSSDCSFLGSDPRRLRSLEAAEVLAIAEAVASNDAILSLSFESCHIGDEGAKSLAQGLAQDASLEFLGLERTGLGGNGAAALASVLRRSKTLHTLDIEHNRVTEEAARVLVEAAGHNPRPAGRLALKLKLDDNVFERSVAKALSAAAALAAAPKPGMPPPQPQDASAAAGQPPAPPQASGDARAGHEAQAAPKQTPKRGWGKSALLSGGSRNAAATAAPSAAARRTAAKGPDRDAVHSETEAETETARCKHFVRGPTVSFQMYLQDLTSLHDGLGTFSLDQAAQLQVYLDGYRLYDPTHPDFVAAVRRVQDLHEDKRTWAQAAVGTAWSVAEQGMKVGISVLTLGSLGYKLMAQKHATARRNQD